MKLVIAVSLFIAAILSLVINLVSNLLSGVALRYKTLIWILFFTLLPTSIFLAIWPEDRSTPQIEVLEVQAKTQTAQNDGKAITAGCDQRVKLVNRGYNFTSFTQYKAIIEYPGFQAVAASSQIGKASFSPNTFGSSLQKLEMDLFPFAGEATLLRLPALIPSQGGIDIDINITFDYDKQTYNIWDIHSPETPQNADLLTVKYLLAMADGTNVETKPISCVYLETKALLLPRSPGQ